MMGELNTVAIHGRLTRDPELRTLNESTICNFTIAHNKWKKVGGEFKEDQMFWPVTTWGYVAERVGEKAKKGDPVVVVGDLRQRRWEKEGQKREITEINARDVQFLKKKPKGEAQSFKTGSNEVPF